MLQVQNLADGRRVKGCSFDLYAGEVLGLAGLVGAGRTELARLVYGAERRSGGEVRLNGTPVVFHNPGEAIDAGVAYLTEDRKAQGLFLDMSVGENINLGVIGRDSRALGLAGSGTGEGPVLGRHPLADHPRAGTGVHGGRPVRRQPAEGAAVAPAGGRSRRC